MKEINLGTCHQSTVVEYCFLVHKHLQVFYAYKINNRIFNDAQLSVKNKTKYKIQYSRLYLRCNGSVSIMHKFRPHNKHFEVIVLY